MKKIWELIKATFSEWSADKASRLAAALAYYTIFSLAPLLIIVIAVAGFVFGEQAARGEVVNQIEGLVGSQGAEAVQTMIENAGASKSTGIVATIIGLATLIFGATGVFAQLQDALNTVWGVEAKSGGGIMGTIKNRLLSFTMVLGIGFLLLVSLAVSAALSGLSNYLNSVMPGSDLIWQILNFVISFSVVTLLFALIFKVLPDVEIDWSDVWMGAIITALLFTIGKFLIGLYLGRSSVSSTYGAAGSLVVLLLWIYYSAQILLLGAEFTQVYANSYGSHIRPDDKAVPVTKAMRARQGLKESEEKAVTAQADPERQSSATSGLDRPLASTSETIERRWSWPVFLGFLLAGVVANAVGILKRDNG